MLLSFSPFVNGAENASVPDTANAGAVSRDQIVGLLMVVRGENTIDFPHFDPMSPPPSCRNNPKPLSASYKEWIRVTLHMGMIHS